MKPQKYVLAIEKVAEFIEKSIKVPHLEWHFLLHLPDMKAFLEKAEDKAYDKIEKAERALEKAGEDYIESVASRISKMTKIPKEYLRSAVDSHAPHPEYSYYDRKELPKVLQLDYSDGYFNDFPKGIKKVLPFLPNAYADISLTMEKLIVAKYEQNNGEFSITLHKHDLAPKFHVARKRMARLEELLR